MKPHIWMNKDSGDLAIVVPWMHIGDEGSWEVKPIIDVVDGISIALAAVAQIGWLFRNEHDVYFGIEMSVQKQFEDLGEL